MQECGLLLLRVRFDLVQLDHRRHDGLHVRDAAFLRVLVTERL